jgi:hypothetical protein
MSRRKKLKSRNRRKSTHRSVKRGPFARKYRGHSTTLPAADFVAKVNVNMYEGLESADIVLSPPYILNIRTHNGPVHRINSGQSETIGMWNITLITRTPVQSLKDIQVIVHQTDITR